MTRLMFELPGTWLWTVPVVLAILAFYFWSLHRRGYTRRQKWVLLSLRSVTLLLLLLLIARPLWVEPEEEEEEAAPREVVLLVDRSASMSLRDGDQTRYQQAVDFARDQLLPALNNEGLRTSAVLFAEDVRAVDGHQLARAAPDGSQTDLAAAIVDGVHGRARPPLAVVALTDGAATRNTQNNRAVAALVENGIPFVGVGFGSESGSQAISLERIDAPSAVSVEQQFFVSVQLRVTGSQQLPAFDLVLLRNGSFVERKRVDPVEAPQIWQESFTVVENEEGYPSYKVRLQPPTTPGLVCTNHEAAASVRVHEEQVLRVLFVQGGLTWDYKFVRLAVEGDPSIQVFGLSRSADRAVFVQNVQDDEELVGGFPNSLEKLSQFRVVVLSNLDPDDLSPEQQTLLDRFCSEYGGGVLMVGGASTFRANWRDSQLEKILPVSLSRMTRPGRRSVRVRLTEAALRHPVFQISDDGASVAAWESLPDFTDYAAVDGIKPGAEVWLEDSYGVAPTAPLMVRQRYGSGLSAAICLQNFWRWRLAKNSNPAQFDRFWRQLLRFLAEGSRDAVTLLVPDQSLKTNADIRVVLQARPDPQQSQRAATNYRVEVADEQKQTISEQVLELRTGQSTEVKFQASEPGLYTVNATDGREVLQATRSIEIRDISLEFVDTSRNMEPLRQWAKLSGGAAVKAEECDNVADLVERITETVRRVRATQPQSVPAGMNEWTLALLLGCLCFEWMMRKRWDLE